MDAPRHATTTSGDAHHDVVTSKHQSDSGLKPLERLTSDDRISRIVPTADYGTDIEFYSVFVREFLRAHYNFCASKMTLARGGKKIALDLTFRESEKWMSKAIKWSRTLDFQRVAMFPDTISVSVTIPLAGRLINLLIDYDELFVTLTAAAFCGAITSDVRDGTLRNAGSAVDAVQYICMPENDLFDAAGIIDQKNWELHLAQIAVIDASRRT